MAGKTTTFPVTGRSSGSSDMPSFSETVFGFLDENYPVSGNISDDSFEEREWGDDVEEDESSASSQEKKAFWDEQEKLLQGVLYRTSSIESRVRKATKEGIRQLEGTNICNCHRRVATDGCRDCLRREIFDHLCNVGFNCSIRKTKWKTSSEIPSGQHTYLEVVEQTSSSKGQVNKFVIIELNLRAEFEMARASEDYNRLIKRLPEVYVGKPERLRTLVKILCGAAKKCMKERKMHLGPWRNHKYMQAKWLGSSNELITPAPASRDTQALAGCSDHPVKTRTSMLTLTLLDKIPRPHCQAVAV